MLMNTHILQWGAQLNKSDETRKGEEDTNLTGLIKENINFIY